MHKITTIILLLILILPSITYSNELFPKYKVGDTIKTEAIGQSLSSVNNLPHMKTASFLSQTIKLVLYLSGIAGMFAMITTVLQLIKSHGDSGKLTAAAKNLTYFIVGVISVAIAYSVIYSIVQLQLE